MQAIFIRHGDAGPAGAGPDADRKLTQEGRNQSLTAAEALRAMGIKLERVLTSPLARAVQTAGAVAEVHDGAKVEVAEFLAPPGNAKALRERLAGLAAEGTSAVGLIGHTPSLEECIGRLVAATRGLGLSLQKAGAACVQVPPPESSDDPELRWLMQRKQLAMLSKAK